MYEQASTAAETILIDLLTHSKHQDQKRVLSIDAFTQIREYSVIDIPLSHVLINGQTNHGMLMTPIHDNIRICVSALYGKRITGEASHSTKDDGTAQ